MPGRRLGQHFLVRQSILERIASAVCAHPGAAVVEIGPGRGALTQYLLECADRVIVVEIDQVLVQYLQQKFRESSRLKVIHQDILKTDLAQWGRICVAGNLPYYITSPIVEKVLALGGLLERAVFLVQREVAGRLTAEPGSRDYGYLTVQTKLFSEPRLLFEVPPAAFRPPPKVDSAVVALQPRAEPLTSDPEAFLHFARTCFRQKRKTLRNNLLAGYEKSIVDSLPGLEQRAEQLPVEELIQLHQRILKG